MYTSVYVSPIICVMKGVEDFQMPLYVVLLYVRMYRAALRVLNS